MQGAGTGLNFSNVPARPAAVPTPAAQAGGGYSPAQQLAKLWMGFEPPSEFQLASRLRGPGEPL